MRTLPGSTVNPAADTRPGNSILCSTLVHGGRSDRIQDAVEPAFEDRGDWLLIEAFRVTEDPSLEGFVAQTCIVSRATMSVTHDCAVQP